MSNGQPILILGLLRDPININDFHSTNICARLNKSSTDNSPSVFNQLML